jgi:hypothetical protein
MSTDTREGGTLPPIRMGTSWPKWLRRGPLELLACMMIGTGVLMLLQPLSLTLYSYSLITTLAGVVMFTIVSKFPD